MPGIVDDGADLNVYGKPLASLSFIYAANRSDIPVVASISDAHVTHSDWRTQSWVDAEPILPGNQVLQPRHARPDRRLPAPVSIAARLRRWAPCIRKHNARECRGRAEPKSDMSEILAHPRRERQGIANRGVHVCRALHITESLMDEI